MTHTPQTNGTCVPSADGVLPGRILIVEDDAILAVTIEMTLRDAGIEDIEMCSTTEMALVALRAKQPDAIVLDVHLADRDDGWTIAELVRSLGPNSPRIVFSTGAPRDIPPEIAELGCVLEKPYDPQTLVDVLREPRRRGIISRLRSALS
jgi:DNA-binding response OmpR family regulator